MPHYDVLIVGAGLAGLTAAKTLATHGRRILVVDKGRSVGGRLATRRMGEAVLDHGAQFFTSRSPEFTEAVTSWQSDGVASEWCRGFGEPDGYPRYHPVVALLTTLGEGAPFGTSGALQRPDDPIFTFCADNQTKGISAVPAATFHAAHALSAELFDLSDAEILHRLRPEAETLLGPARIRSIQVKKWRFAGPVEPWPDRCAVISSGPSPLVLCGDGFGGPKLEGAYLSGLAAARATLTASS